MVWTGVSIIMLLAGISGMVWWHAAKKSEEEVPHFPENDPLGKWVATPIKPLPRADWTARPAPPIEYAWANFHWVGGVGGTLRSIPVPRRSFPADRPRRAMCCSSGDLDSSGA